MFIRLKSSLFLRIFSITALAICVLFSIMYLLAVPFIQQTVESIEKNVGHTVMNGVHDAVEQAYADIEDYRNSLIMERKSQLRNIIALTEMRINNMEKAVRRGELTKEKARDILLEEFRQIKYGKDDYIWISDYRSTLISHPDPRFNGADFSELRDERNKLIVPPMVAGALETGDSFYTYWWRRLGEQKQIEKLSYYKNIPFFSMVIGTGVYLDDVEETVQRKRTRTIERLRNQLRTVHLAKSGYVYIFDGQVKMVIHPNSNIENTDFSNQLNPSTNNPIGQELMSLADKQEGLRYLWDRPSDPGNYSYPKISWVRYSKGFDWYICSSVYVDELDQSANALRNRVVAVFTITLFVAVLLVYFFVNRLTDPLRKLRDTASRVKLGDFSARCNLERSDEIGVVATAFNDMVERLQENIIDLDAKVVERTAELEKLNTKLTELNTTDALTGIANRRQFDETLINEWNRCGRQEQSLALAMLDVDWFKNYNDHYGHQAGDKCLCKIADTLSATIRRSGDLVARYGGEEFAFILPGTSREDALLLAQSVCSAVFDEKLPHITSPLEHITVSVGIAVITPKQSDQPDDLLKMADESLYHAKNMGRNQVISIT